MGFNYDPEIVTDTAKHWINSQKKINKDNYTSETLITHKSSNLKKIIKKTMFVNK